MAGRRSLTRGAGRAAAGAAAALPILLVLAIVVRAGPDRPAPPPPAAPMGSAWATAPGDYDCRRSLYVSPTGSDAGPGTRARPWRTIAHALTLDRAPGDCVVLGDGTYREAVVWAGTGGAADAPTGFVVLRAAHPGAARIRPPPGTYSALAIRSSYVVVDGLDVVGGSGHAIDIEDVHHVMVLRSRVHDSGGSGLSAVRSEFLVFEGNVAFGNAATNGYQCSGISIYQARPVAGDEASAGYRNIVRGNVSFGNVEGPAVPEPHTDGNGIIIDDFQHTHSPGVPAYPHPTLVENNVVYGNGGKGIQVTWSDHVTVRNNTAYRDNRDLANPGRWRGELSNAQSSDNLWINNIAVADAGIHPDNTAFDSTSYGGYENRGVIWAGNLGHMIGGRGRLVRDDGGNPAPDDGANLLGPDPLFLAPGWGEGADFRLGAGSPAIDAGTGGYGRPLRDIGGRPRVAGAGIDLGAHERSPDLTPP